MARATNAHAREVVNPFINGLFVSFAVIHHCKRIRVLAPEY